jgi:hypothetical protein
MRNRRSPENMVGNDDSGENGEALFGVERDVVLIAVDSRQLDLVPGSAGVTEVTHQNGVLGTRQPPRRHLKRRCYGQISAKCRAIIRDAMSRQRANI